MTAVDKGNLKMHNKNQFTLYKYNYNNNNCALLSLRSPFFFIYFLDNDKGKE